MHHVHTQQVWTTAGYAKALFAQSHQPASRFSQLQGAIALEVGYGSIGPFNRAFKALMRMTPTEYRAAGRADSAAQLRNLGRMSSETDEN
ncbi:MAG TPA: hypothetical protein VI958_01835 [Acidobacteriota bacterium]